MVDLAPKIGIKITDANGEPRWPPVLLFRLPWRRGTVSVDSMQVGAIGTYVVISGATIAAIWWFSVVGFTLFDLFLIIACTFVTGLGITLGYHRLFSHKAFDASKPVRIALGIFGAAALQGQIQVWASVHRKHHHHSDRTDDPHSPRSADGAGRWAAIFSAFDAHVGWILTGRFFCYLPYVRDLRKDKVVQFVDRNYWIWAAAGLLVPGLIGALWHGGLEGFVSGVFAGGILRAFFHLNTTWAVNSLAHLFGRRPFLTNDDSSNNALVNFLSMNGEGLHNNHHAFPWSARFSMHRGELDPGYWILILLKHLGLVWNIKEPNPAQIRSRLRNAA